MNDVIGEEERRLVLRIGSAVSQGLEPRGFALSLLLAYGQRGLDRNPR